jgi:outer membrane protein
MRRLIIITAAVLACYCAQAQNFIVVDTGKIFESIPAWKSATATLEELAQTRQAAIDAAYAEVEAMYNSYVQQKAVLTEIARQQREKAIIDRESEITKRQEEVFGPEGELNQRREALLKPIQDKVIGTIKSYAASVGAAVALDVAEVIYYAPAADRTQEIINLVK